MEQKPIEQVAAEKYPYRDFLLAKSDAEQAEIDQHNRLAVVKRLTFLDGIKYAQSQQPMWREIEPNEEYDCVIAKWKETGVHRIDWCVDGAWLISRGYTHYLASEELLKLPVEKK